MNVTKKTKIELHSLNIYSKQAGKNYVIFSIAPIEAPLSINVNLSN